MSHPLEPKQHQGINEKQAIAMEGMDTVEPGRREQALDPGPEEYQVDLFAFADPSCSRCHGRALISVNKPGSSKLYPMACSCAEKGYQKFMAKRIKFPCRRCGNTGYCQHRPRTFDQMLGELVDTSLKVKARMEPQDIRRDDGTETEQGSSGQNIIGIEQPGA